MAKSRLRIVGRPGPGHPRIGEPRFENRPPTAASVSLPPPTVGSPLSPPLALKAAPACTRCGAIFRRPRSKCPECGEIHPDKAALPANIRTMKENSVVREKALKIWVMRSAHIPEEEIAKAIGLNKSCLSGYIYKAGKNGWLDFDDPKDQLEYQLMHKVIRNLDEGLDSGAVLNTGMAEKTAVALKMAEGTLFRKFEEQPLAQPTTIVGVRVEVVQGAATDVREGTVQGVPHYTEAEVKE